MSNRREPNHQLEALLAEARFSRKGLARRVSELAATQGLSVLCDHTSVARWLSGSVPRDPTPTLLAQVFSHHIGRTVTPRDLGMEMASEDQTIGLRYPRTLGCAVETVTRLWRYDVERRGFLTDSVFAAGAVSVASRDWLIGSPREDLSQHSRSTRVTMADVREVRALGDEFERLSHEFGSQRIRRHMVNYLRYDVGPLLKKSRTDTVGRALLQTAAEFTASAGYMAIDCNQLNLAERYYIQALALASAADSRHYGAQVMATHMGHLALYAEHPAEAVQLAEAARAGGRQNGEPLGIAVSWVVEARGHARMGDARACGRALSEAERHFGRSGPAHDSPPYLRYFKEAYLADAFAHCFRDLNQPKKASEYAMAALRDLPATHIRRRAINTGILAHANLSKDEPEEAARHGLEAVRLTRQLHSPRAFRRIARLRKRFDPYRQAPGVAAFLEQADGLVADAAV
ncbi:transcriptional regulator [Streptomyces sp. S465]|uniref:transcriptional regulator n=1 Tax=Streptomyces sp. S465 TaxID=2979468 RepID=UPI0022A873DA|nr:transcriptional regulator [Streptomyces sp. S465]WAP56956.1 transcriptional regulator [Streptomyces sp. S465]